MVNRFFIDMDGTLFRWNNVSYVEKLYEKDYFLNLDPIPNMVNAITHLLEEGKDVYILSKYLTDSKYALSEKRESLKKILPSLAEEKFIFVPIDCDKSRYIPSGIKCTDFLIDDYTLNLREWELAGGTGIKFLNGINHTQGSWQGIKVCDNASLLYDIQSNIEKVMQFFKNNENEFDKENNVLKEYDKEMEY